MHPHSLAAYELSDLISVHSYLRLMLNIRVKTKVLLSVSMFADAMPGL